MAKAAGTAGQDKAQGPRSSALWCVAEHNGVLCFVCVHVWLWGSIRVCTTYVSLCLCDGQRPSSDAIHFALDVVCVCVCYEYRTLRHQRASHSLELDLELQALLHHPVWAIKRTLVLRKSSICS